MVKANRQREDYYAWSELVKAGDRGNRGFLLLVAIPRRQAELRVEVLPEDASPGRRRDKLLALDGRWTPLDFDELASRRLDASNRVLYCRELQRMIATGLIESMRADGAKRATHVRLTLRGRRVLKCFMAFRAGVDAALAAGESPGRAQVCGDRALAVYLATKRRVGLPVQQRESVPV